MVLNSLLDPVLGPLLKLDPFFALLILSFLISAIITLIYKYTTDQNLMKTLKEEIKEFQAEMKTLKDNPAKMMEVQKKAMQTNMKYMMQSFRSTLFTFIPIIIIFSWMSAHLAYEPLNPAEEFLVTVNFDEIASGVALLEVPTGLSVVGPAEKEIVGAEASFVVSGESGRYEGSNALKVVYNEQQAFKDVIITDAFEYAPVTEAVDSGNIQSITLGNKPIKILNLFGWKVGWLGTYIIFSIIFSMLLRKIFKIY